MTTDEKLNKLLAEVQSLKLQIAVLTGPGQLRQKFWTVDQTMDFLKMSRNTVYKHAARLGGHKVGRQWRFKPELVENFKGEL
jgi:excisionase family DNA binding protein